MLFYAKVGAAKDNLHCMQYKYCSMHVCESFKEKLACISTLLASISTYVVQHLRVKKKLAFNFRE